LAGGTRNERRLVRWQRIAATGRVGEKRVEQPSLYASMSPTSPTYRPPPIVRLQPSSFRPSVHPPHHITTRPPTHPQVIQKIVSQGDTCDNLMQLTKENEQKLENLAADKLQLKQKVEELKYAGPAARQGGRKVVDRYVCAHTSAGLVRARRLLISGMSTMDVCVLCVDGRSRQAGRLEHAHTNTRASRGVGVVWCGVTPMEIAECGWGGW
jgi:hypothetical protein